MAKQRRGGKRLSEKRRNAREHRQDHVVNFLPTSELGTESGNAVGDDSAEPTKLKSRGLDPLSDGELFATYGKGLDLLKRMGFAVGSGLRNGSLKTPLRPHSQGKSKLGVQSAEELPAPEPSVSVGADRPTTALLTAVLASMREAGDNAEAEDLQRLAACVPFSSQELECASPSETESNSDDNVAVPSAAAREAIAAVLDGLCCDEAFPIEASEQAIKLRWTKRFRGRLGSYEDFLERFGEDQLRVVPCPAPHGTLVMPRLREGGGSPWTGSARYIAWCQDRRRNASGKAQRKWRHVEAMITRFSRGVLCSSVSLGSNSSELGVFDADCVAEAKPPDEHAAVTSTSPAIDRKTMALNVTSRPQGSTLTVLTTGQENQKRKRKVDVAPVDGIAVSKSRTGLRSRSSSSDDELSWCEDVVGSASLISNSLT